jgi:hypothetical protein
MYLKQKEIITSSKNITEFINNIAPLVVNSDLKTLLVENDSYYYTIFVEYTQSSLSLTPKSLTTNINIYKNAVEYINSASSNIEKENRLKNVLIQANEKGKLNEFINTQMA